MRRNANPNTLRKMSRVDGDFSHRLNPMSQGRSRRMDEKPLPFLGQSALDATKNKRRLLKIISSANNVRLRRDLYDLSIVKFMSLYENRIMEDICDDYVHRIYSRKKPEQLRQISSSCYHDHLCDHCMNTLKGYLQSGKIKLHHLCRYYH